ncbi:hypothetical protein RQP46_010018 [Phenoliferia psychrophenolica]
MALGFFEMVLNIVLLTAFISPVSARGILSFSSLVLSQAIQTFAHALLIYSCRSLGKEGLIEGVTSLGVALAVNAVLCAALITSPYNAHMRLPGFVLVVVALVQAAGISFWVTGNQWTSLFVSIPFYANQEFCSLIAAPRVPQIAPLASIYLVTVLLALHRSTQTYTIRSGLCAHAVRENGSRTSFIFASSPAESIMEPSDSRENLTALSGQTVSSRWSRETTTVDRAKRRLFSSPRKAKARDGVVGAGPPPMPVSNDLPPVSELVTSRPPPSQAPPPLRDSHTFTNSNVPATYLVPPKNDTPSYPFVQSRPYPGTYPQAPFSSTGGARPGNQAASPIPFQNLFPPPLLSDMNIRMTVTPDLAAEILGLRMMTDPGSPFTGGSEGRRDDDESAVDVILPPQPPQRLTNPYSPAAPTSPTTSSPSKSYPSSPLTVQNLSAQEKQLRDAMERQDDDLGFRPASTVASEQGSVLDPDLDFSTQKNETLHIPALVGAFPKLRAAVDSTVAYSSLPPTTPTTPLAGGKRTRFRFWNCDSYDAAERLVDVWGSEKVAVLNMANAFNPGGGYLNGAMAQEEALCRRSTLFAHISHPQLYPIHLEGGLFSPDVLIFRETNGDIRDSDAYFSVGVVSVAAIDRPRLTPTGEHYADAREEQTTVHKIMAILRIAKLQGQKAIVLGAFGCGAFRNPPSRMATLFLRALTEDPEFTDTFDEVVFAILEVGGSDNMRPWRDVWTGVAEDEAAAATPAADHDAIDEDEDDDIIIVEAPLPVPSAPEPGTAKEGEEAEEGPPAPIVEAGEVVAASSDLGTDSAIPEVSVLTSPYFAGKKS